MAGARKSYERALRIDEASFGPDHPNVANSVNNLGSVLHDLGDLATARQCFERGLRIAEATLGPDHLSVATLVNNLGNVLQNLGDLAGAREYYERSLRIDETSFGPDHPEVATDVNNLSYERRLVARLLEDIGDVGGGVLKELGDLAAARQCYDRALQIDEAAFGPDHPEVATDVSNLGLLLRDLGDLAGAHQCLERALRIFRKFLGDNHPKTVLVRNKLESLK